MEPLTVVEQRVLDAIKSHQAEYGYSPSYRDLMRATHRASPSSIQRAIHRLKDKGHLTYLPNQPRTLRVVEGG